MKHAPTRILVGIVVAAILLAACSGSTTVGKNLQTQGFSGQTSGQLGDETTTTTRVAAPPTTARATAVTQPHHAAPSPTTTPAAAPKATTPTQQVAIQIAINSDSASAQFVPAVAKIYTGTCAQFTNDDSVPRSVVADDNTFASPLISPGQHWVLCLSTPGTHNYHDGTRPYAVGTLEAVAR